MLIGKDMYFEMKARRIEADLQILKLQVHYSLLSMKNNSHNRTSQYWS